MTTVTTSATYKTKVTANLPDFALRDITFRLVAAFFNGAGEEVIDGTTYTMTLDASGVDDGAFYLPTPDNTGTAGANWFVTLPSGYEDIVTVAYSGAAQAVADLLAAGATTTDPDVITAALAAKQAKDLTATNGYLAVFLDGQTVAGTGAPGSAALANTEDFDAAGAAAAAQAASQPLDADLSAIAGLSSADSNFIVGSATGWVAESGATARTSLGLGTIATAAAADYMLIDAQILPKSTTYQLAAGDAGKIIECNGTFTVTAPDGLDTGFQVALVNVGSGIITVAAATTLQAKGAAYTLANQYGMATLYHRGSNVWLLAGDLT